jgi:aminomethyltransferase
LKRYDSIVIGAGHNGLACAALLEHKKRGSKYALTKLDIEGNRPAVKANIALAMIETKHLKGDLWAEIYYEKELRHYGRVVKCTRKTKPFWTPDRARATPPPDC